MNYTINLILSLSSLLFFLYLLLSKKLPLLTASLATLLVIFGQTIFYWQIVPSVLFISFAKGLFLALDIFLIIFGALFFLEILKSLNIINNLAYYLGSFSKDYRVQVILLAWFFENFIEGTAGFGTPAAIVAPILVSLGLSPFNAVVLSLLGNSTASAFGAAGTPIRVGFAGINTLGIPYYTAAINGIGILVPVFMILALKNHFREVLPFALWSGLLFVLPSFLTVSLGQEFPSILGSALGLFLIIIFTRLGLFLPKTVRRLHPLHQPKNILPPLLVIYPYVLLIILLIIGKFTLSSSKIDLSFINHSISFFNPGLAFLAAGFLVAVISKKSLLLSRSLNLSFQRAIEPFLVIASMSAIVQLMINSGENFSGLPSILEIISQKFHTFALPFFAPFIGAFGSFLTGSATISNILFGNLLKDAAQALNLNVAKILALQLVGAAAGNMIALSDMLAAETVVGLRHYERHLIKQLIIPCGIYVLLAGCIGILI